MAKDSGSKSYATSLRNQVRKLERRYPTLARELSGRRGKLVVLAAIALFIGYVGYGQLYKPRKRKLERIKVRIEKVTSAIQEMKEEMPDVASAQHFLEAKDEEMETLRARLRSEESRLPSREQLPEILSQLTNKKQSEEITFLSVAPVEQEKKKKQKKAKEEAEILFYPEIGFRVEMLARFWDLIAYLSRLEQVSPYFSFPALEVQMDKRGEDQPEVNLELRSVLYDRLRRAAEEEMVFRQDIKEFEYVGTKADPFALPYEPAPELPVGKVYEVSGIIWRGGEKVAIINNQVVRQGERLGDSLVVSIEDSKIVLSESGREYEIGI